MFDMYHVYCNTRSVCDIYSFIGQHITLQSISLTFVSGELAAFIRFIPQGSWHNLKAMKDVHIRLVLYA